MIGFLVFVLSTTANLQLPVLDIPNLDGVLVRLRVHTTVCESANNLENSDARSSVTITSDCAYMSTITKY